MHPFIRRHLDPVDRLGEALFALVMALGFTGAVRLGLEQADSRELLVGILGCNLAWGLVDGAMYVLTATFERGRRARLTHEVRAASSDATALERIAGELDEPLGTLMTPDELATVRLWVLKRLRSDEPVSTRVHREDILGGLAVALLIVLATLPIVVPFLLVADAELAVRLSHLIAVLLLFLLGARWARLVGQPPWRLALGLTLIGSLLVLVTIALGG